MKFINRIKEIIKQREFKYISFFWIVISIQFVLGSNLQYGGYSVETLSDLLASLLEIFILYIFFISMHYCVLEVIKKYKGNKSKKENNKKEVAKTIKINKTFIYFVIIIISWIPILLAFNPIISNYDGADQIADYILGDLNTGNPILHTFLLTRFYIIGVTLGNPNLGMLLFSIFQMSIMAAIFASGVRFIEEKTNKKWLRNISLIFYAVFPFNQLFPLMTTKDTLFAGFTMMFIICIYKVMEEREKVSASDYICTIIMTTLMILFRSNAIYAFVVSIPFIILILFKDKENLKNVLGIIIISIILYVIVFNAFAVLMGAEKSDPTVSKICMISQGVGRLSKERKDELTEEEKEKMTYYYRDYRIVGLFYKENIADYTADLIKTDRIYEDKKAYTDFTVSLIKKYPLTFVDAYLNTIRGYWYITDNSFYKIKHTLEPNSIGCLELMTNKIAQDEFAIHADSKLPGLKIFYKKAFCRNEYTYIPFLYVVFQPGIYTYILLAFLLYSMCKKQKKCLVIEVYLGLYLLTCFLAPCAIIRYIYNIIVSVPLLAGITINEKKKEEK